MRNIYCADDTIELSEHIGELDDMDCFRCWQDEETQKGYNVKFVKSFESFTNAGVQSRFIATVIRKTDGICVGSIFLSPESTLPDLAIMIYRPYRRKGYASRAFLLGTQYCFDKFNLECIYAGCYQDNIGSLQMLSRCGFVPHPEGNRHEKHFITGAEIVQKDFLKYNPDWMK